MNRKVVSLERFREFIESLIMYAIMIGCSVALVISIVIIVVEASGTRQVNEWPKERSLSSMKSPRTAPGSRPNPVFPR